MVYPCAMITADYPAYREEYCVARHYVSPLLKSRRHCRKWRWREEQVRRRRKGVSGIQRCISKRRIDWHSSRISCRERYFKICASKTNTRS